MEILLILIVAAILIVIGSMIRNRRWRTASEEYEAKWDSRREYFKTAWDKAGYFLEWWQQYSKNAPDTGTPSLPALLRRTRRQAEQGIQMMDEMQGEFDQLTNWKEIRHEENRIKANHYLEAVLITQDALYRERDEDASDYSDILPPDIPEPLLNILDQVVNRLLNVQGWNGYKQELYQQGRRLVELLDSPAYNAVVEQQIRLAQRFPNPHEVQQQYAPESAADRIEKRMDRWETTASWIALAYMFTNQNNK